MWDLTLSAYGLHIGLKIDTSIDYSDVWIEIYLGFSGNFRQPIYLSIYLFDLSIYTSTIHQSTIDVTLNPKPKTIYIYDKFIYLRCLYTISLYRVARMHRMPYLYRSFPAKEPHN